MASLGVVPVHQPSFLYDSGDDFLPRLGERAHGLKPYRSELELGLRPIISSDSFVASLRPLESIANAILRRTRECRAIGPDQALTLPEAIRAHTLDAAHSIHMEDRIGSLEPGKLADITIVDGDLASTPPEQLAELPIWMTVIDGRVAWAAEGAPAA
jgi:predicted amidohydrolase YtcJ